VAVNAAPSQNDAVADLSAVFEGISQMQHMHMKEQGLFNHDMISFSFGCC
jgi:hypothetical protein